MKKILFLALVLLAPAASAYEEVCGDSCADKNGGLPTCEELGYSQNRFCPEGYVTCPFDESYIWCKDYSCSMSGLFTKDETQARRAQGYLCSKVKVHGMTCYDCDEVDKSVCVYDATNKGEGTLGGTKCGDGSWTECTRGCAAKDISATLPTDPGVIPVASTCMSCGVQETIITDFTCAENYTKNDNTCEPAACPTPSIYTDIPYTASDAQNCNSKTHPQGWIFDKNGKSGGKTCSRCIPKSCPLGFQSGLSSCPNTTGYTYEQGGYNGDNVCGYCRNLTCLAPYNAKYQSVADCPTLSNSDWSAAKAWNYSQDSTMAGDKACGLCEPKACADGYNQLFQSVADCPNTVGYTFEYDKNHFYGDKYCGRCVAKTCAQGAPDLTVSQCISDYDYPSQIGASVVPTEEYVGMERCKVCQCDASTLCKYNAQNLGDSGEGVDVCCDGTSYRSCSKKSSCDGVDALQIEHAKATTACSACGTTYLKVTACDDGYKPADNGKSCILKTCSDYDLKSSESECSSQQGYVAQNSTEHPGCYSCVAKTCELWGNEAGQTWHLYQSSSTCPDGYLLTTHDKKIAGVSKQCYDCETCRTEPGYIAVDSPAAVPAIVTEKNLIKSCEKYQYCATACTEGYAVNNCTCVEAACAGYTAMSGLTKVDDQTYTDGTHNYSVCKKGGNLLYKVSGCASGYSSISSCSGIGESRIGSTKGSYACYRCICNNVNQTNCPWTSDNIGTAGTGVNACCDGSSYTQCQRNTSVCNYTLTSKPVNADTTDTCQACGQTYYKATKCKTGYTGDTCSACDTANGYASCNNSCSQKPNCGAHGDAKCTSSGWTCDCDPGYQGSSCNSCSNGYRDCSGVCHQEFSCGDHGSLACGASGLKCNCATGYTGTYCNTCAEGYYDYGNGCVLVQGCGHGTFDGTQCVCETCYHGSDCTTLRSTCYIDPDDGTAKPKTCQSQGFSTSCDEACENCVPRTVETTTGTLDCFEITPKSCSEFCGNYNLTSQTTSVVLEANCTSTLNVFSNNIFSWLSDDPISAVSVDRCGKTCYFDDEICSSGEKLSAEQKAQRQAEGYICGEAGRTAAGSQCYICVSDVCPNNLVHYNDVSDKVNQGYECSVKVGVKTAAGTQCYECLTNFCENGAAYSSQDVDAAYNLCRYQLNSKPSCADDYTYTSSSQTETGAYCYQNFEPADCSAVTSNDLYATSSACIAAITDMVDFSNYVMADCHACVDSTGGKAIVKWYPACLSAYANQPQDPDSGVLYQNGENCCITGYQNDLGENISTPVYARQVINMRTYSLGTSANAQTCYAKDAACPIQAVEDAYCGGTLCTEVTCDDYPYNYQTKPENSQLSGNSCISRTTDCATAEVVQYDDFECDRMYVKSADGTSCELSCDNSQGYYDQRGGCPTGAKCEQSDVEGCVIAVGCSNDYSSNGGYISANAECFPYFSHNPQTVSFYVGTTLTTCYEITGCSELALDFDSLSPTMSQLSDPFNMEGCVGRKGLSTEGLNCQYPTGCADNYVGYEGNGSYSCPDGLDLQDTATFGNWTCGKCQGCRQCSHYTSGTTRLQQNECAEGWNQTVEPKALCTRTPDVMTNCYKCTLPDACHVTNTAALHSTMASCTTAINGHGSCNYCSFDGSVYAEPSCNEGYQYNTALDKCVPSSCLEQNSSLTTQVVDGKCDGVTDFATCWYSSGGYAGFETLTQYCDVTCPSGYALNNEQCGDGRRIQTSTPIQSGPLTCYLCTCNQSQGYYSTCPTGAACDSATTVNGVTCSQTNACASGYYVSSTNWLQYFGVLDTKNFNLNGTETTCVKPSTECSASYTTQTDCYLNTNGADGWDWVEAHRGCGTCTAKTCPINYTSEPISSCGCGETFAQSTTFSGEQPCNKCEEITCLLNEIPEGTNYIDTLGDNYGPVSYWPTMCEFGYLYADSDSCYTDAAGESYGPVSYWTYDNLHAVVCDTSLNLCKSGNACYQVDPCAGYYSQASLPDNASFDTYSQSCTYVSANSDGTCASIEKHYQNFVCNEGFKLNNDGTDCLLKSCADYPNYPYYGCPSGYICSSADVPAGNSSMTCYHYANCHPSEGYYNICPQGTSCSESSVAPGCRVVDYCDESLNYYNSKPQGLTCSSVSYYDTDGNQNHCYYNCQQCNNTCGSGTYLDCEAEGLGSNVSAVYQNSCGADCHTCTCDFQYQQPADPVKSGSPSCTRNGQTYYKEICEGASSRTPCNNDSTKMYTDVCHAYNGTPYYSGLCEDIPQLTATAQYYGINATGRCNVAGRSVYTYFKVFTSSNVLSTPVLTGDISYSTYDASGGVQSYTNVPLGNLMPGNYYLYVDKETYYAGTDPAGCPCGIVSITVNGQCYTSDTSMGLLYSGCQDTANALPLPDLATNPIRFTVTASTTNNVFVYGRCSEQSL